MELYQTESHYILLDSEFTLWCNRTTGALEPKRGNDLCSAWNPVCVGLIYGLIGKIRLHPDSDWSLLLIKQRSLVGEIAEKHKIFKINKIAVLSLTSTDPSELDLEFCKTHHFGIRKTEQISRPELLQKPLLKTWNTIKSAAENVKPKKKEVKDKEKFEKRILEELLKMFNDDESFYYSETYDLTCNLQYQHSNEYDEALPMWKRCDNRFFWNKHMIQELIDFKSEEIGLPDPWIVPIVHGYIQMAKCRMDFGENVSPDDSPGDYAASIKPLEYDVWLLSRRSQHRAGTRSKKRGLDETGACANYVETEQIIEFSPHIVSFVQVRGSIPVYWSQTGIKYRPPPRLDRDEKQAHEAFTKHFKEQLNLYKKISIITLAELSGKEAVLSDAFLTHVLQFNSPDLTFVTFDFHEYCRGMKFENVSLLTEGIKDMIKDMRYCWVDNKGLICEQQGVFRINCIDCLDRTNVVQTAIARIVMETQFRKLGLLPPEEMLPPSCRITYQQLWANNGDAISRQYAGTAALKGDFTRTGERKFAGMMKDGVNSANRYYLRFRDDYRQAAMDIILGQPVSAEVLTLTGKVSDLDEVDDTSELIEKEENVKMLLEDCKKMLIVEPEQCIGGWCLINADPNTGDPDRQEMDIILLLSQRAVYVAWYDDEVDQLNQYQKIYVEDIEKLEIGLEPGIFKSRYVCLRIYYHCFAEEGFFHTFRVPSTRLFNNVIIAVKNQEEAKESLRAVGQSFIAGQEILSLELQVIEKHKLERKKTRPHPEIMDIHKQQQENSLASIQLPRDISTDISHSLQLDVSTKNTNNHTNCQEYQAEKTSPNRNPIEFLQAAIRNPFKKPTLPSFTTPSIKLNFSKPNLSLNSAARVAAKFTNVFYTSVKLGSKSKNKEVNVQENDESNSSEENSEVDDMLEVKATEDIDEEVILGSCGILATSPSQLLLNTQLRNKEKRVLRQRIRSTSEEDSDSMIKLVALKIAPDVNNSHLLEQSRNVDKSANQTSGTIDITSNQSVETDDNITYQSSGLESSDSTQLTNKLPQPGAAIDSQIPVLTIDLEPKKDIKTNTDLNNEQTILQEHSAKSPVVKKSDHLHHPSMKMSLSETSLSLPSESERKGVHADGNPFMKLKLKMSNITLPGGASSSSSLKPPSFKSRTVIRKSQRLIELFEELVRVKLENRECESKFIFI